MTDTPDQKNLAEDAALVRGSMEGQAGAFRRLIEKYQDMAYSLCLRMLGNAQDAEDVVQETFIKIYDHLGDYRADAKFSNWLYTIALNICRNRLRRRRIIRFVSLGVMGRDGEQEALADIPDPDASVERQFEGREAEALLLSLARELPESLRESFLLRYSCDASDAAIADMLGISIENVRVRLHRAKERLWRQFREVKGAGCNPAPSQG